MHLVLATHATAFLLLVPDLFFVGVVSPILRTLRGDRELAFWTTQTIVVVSIIAPFAWWYWADRKLFDSSRFQSAWRSIVVWIGGYVVGVIVHQAITFHLTMRALGS